jgi:uncharacterized membrane protein
LVAAVSAVAASAAAASAAAAGAASGAAAPQEDGEMDLTRLWRHLTTWPLHTRRRFPIATLTAIEKAIVAVESRHAGEIRFAVETSLDLRSLRAGLEPRTRALEVFGLLRVWDTERNNGVLIYLLMADRDVEIVADRGIAARVPSERWEEVCRAMEAHFREERWREGSLAGIEGIAALLSEHFPNEGGDRDEQPNRPVLL